MEGVLDLGLFTVDSCQDGYFYNVSSSSCALCSLGEAPDRVYFCSACPAGYVQLFICFLVSTI